MRCQDSLDPRPVFDLVPFSPVVVLHQEILFFLPLSLSSEREKKKKEENVSSSPECMSDSWVLHSLAEKEKKF